MPEEVKTTIGQIEVCYSVACPHCNYLYDSDSDWFYTIFGLAFPEKGDLDCEYKTTCVNCEKEFIVKGFQR